MFQPTADCDLSLDHWLEFLASIDYLLFFLNQSVEDARKILTKEKGDLVSCFDKGIETLNVFGLLDRKMDDRKKRTSRHRFNSVVDNKRNAMVLLLSQNKLIFDSK